MTVLLDPYLDGSNSIFSSSSLVQATPLDKEGPILRRGRHQDVKLMSLQMIPTVTTVRTSTTKSLRADPPSCLPWPAHGPSLSDPWPFPEPQPPFWLWWHLHQHSQHRLLALIERMRMRRRGGGRSVKGKSSSSSSLYMEEEEEEETSAFSYLRLGVNKGKLWRDKKQQQIREQLFAHLNPSFQTLRRDWSKGGKIG